MTPLRIPIVKQSLVLVLDILDYFEQQDEGAAATAASSGVASAPAPQPSEGPCPGQGHRPRKPSTTQPAGGPHMRGALSSRTELGYNPLHVASAFFNTRLVDALLQRGALETGKDADGRITIPFHHPAISAAGDAVGVEVDARDVVVRKAQSRAVIRSLARGPAFRARSWYWPDAALVVASRRAWACRSERLRLIRVAPGGGKREIALAFLGVPLAAVFGAPQTCLRRRPFVAIVVAVGAGACGEELVRSRWTAPSSR